jgi:hypothetical protein
VVPRTPDGCRRALRALLVASAAVLAVAAHASQTRLRLERLDASDYASDHQLRVYASVVELEGGVDDGRPPPAFTLLIDGRPAGHPEKLAPFGGTAEPLDLVLVIESSALYGTATAAAPEPPLPSPRLATPPKRAPATPKRRQPRPVHKVKRPASAGAPPSRSATDSARVARPPDAARTVGSGEEPLEQVKDAMRELLEGLSPKVRVFVVEYGGDVRAHPPFVPARAAAATVDELAPDDESGDLRLVDAVQAALRELARPRADDAPPPRRLIALVSDGLNSQMDKKTFRALGEAAARARVPIHSIAFSPTDERGPLINLGEISKRSNGTFRWARTADDLRQQIETLADELNKQYVLTFALALPSLEGHTFQLTCGELTSNTLTYDKEGGAFGYAARRAGGRHAWLWYTLGTLLALFAAWMAVGVALQARSGAALLFVDAARVGRRLPVRAELVLGKDALADAAVSARHARLYREAGAWWIVDLESTNGTFVNEQRLAGPVRLSDGDVVRVGQTRLRWKATA